MVFVFASWVKVFVVLVFSCQHWLWLRLGLPLISGTLFWAIPPRSQAQMNTDCHLNLSRTADICQALEAILPHPKMLPMTWRQHLFFPIPTVLFKTCYLWAFPPRSNLCTPAHSSVSTGWSNPMPFQTSELCTLETSPCSVSHLKSFLFSPEELPWCLRTVHFIHWFYYQTTVWLLQLSPAMFRLCQAFSSPVSEPLGAFSSSQSQMQHERLMN